jgi:hypothetical protein
MNNHPYDESMHIPRSLEVASYLLQPTVAHPAQHSQPAPVGYYKILMCPFNTIRLSRANCLLDFTSSHSSEKRNFQHGGWQTELIRIE